MSVNKNLQKKCYQLLNLIIENCKDGKSKPTDLNTLVNIINNAINVEKTNGHSELLLTFVELFINYINGKISKQVIQYYLAKQYQIQKNDIEKFISSIQYFYDKNQNKNYEVKISKNKKDKYEKVSVIITTFNRKEFLKEAIYSFLNQDYPNIEIIVMDDCSIDDTSEMIWETFGNEERVIYLQNKKNEGPGISRRNAFKSHARGEYVIFFDDDDYLIDLNYISKAVDFHIKHPEVAFVGAGTLVEYTKINHLKLSFLNLNGVIDKKDYFMNFMSKGFPKPCTTTTVFKREALLEMKIMEMNMVNDTPIFLRSLLVGDAGFIDTIAGVYRIHGGNITFSCSREFIIDNLKEKLLIRDLAIKLNGYNTKEMDVWLNHNGYVTIAYFLNNSAKSAEDFQCMYDWARLHCPELKNKLVSEFKGKLLKQKIYSTYLSTSKIPLIGKLVTSINMLRKNIGLN